MRTLAPTLGLERSFLLLMTLWGAMLGTREAQLSSEVAQARRNGDAFDPKRSILFTRLFEGLSATAPIFRQSTDNGNSVLCFL